jgi:MFS family permease
LKQVRVTISHSQVEEVGMARVHYAWVVAGVAFATLVAAAAFRAAPGPLMVPLHEDLGWSIVTMSAAVGVNLVLYGLTAPFAAALMERFGLRRVASAGLLLIAAGAGLSVFAQAAWQLVLTWGVLIGLGTGSMALVFAATVANAWFVKRRGLVMGILTAGGAAGLLVFLPVLAFVATATSWQVASLLVTAAAIAVLPLVAVLLRDRPSDLGLAPFGGDAVVRPPAARESAAGLALGALREAAHTRAFWALAAAFAICGATTNGLIGIHFIPSAHDHGMATTTAAGLLTMVGLFDIVGTVASGWLTDRIDPRWLLVVYYTFRGLGLVLLPWLLADTVHPSMVVFVVVYGLDWVATVPPTVVVCRQLFGDRGTVVFGWVFVRIAPARRSGGCPCGRGHPRLVRELHLRLVRRRRAVCDRRGALDQPAPPSRGHANVQRVDHHRTRQRRRGRVRFRPDAVTSTTTLV